MVVCNYLYLLILYGFSNLLDNIIIYTLQVADQICSLHKLCSTQQLDAAKDLIGRITSIETKKECSHDNKDDITKDSVTMEQQTDGGYHSNDTNKASEQQTVGDTSKDSPTVKMEQLTLQDNSLVPVADSNMDDGWEVVKKKKKRK